MTGRRWARCWTLRADAPYWNGQSSGWLPGQDDGDGTDAVESEAPQKGGRLSRRFRLGARRRIKRCR